jgi:hypothetical protein
MIPFVQRQCETVTWYSTYQYAPQTYCNFETRLFDVGLGGFGQGFKEALSAAHTNYHLANTNPFKISCMHVALFPAPTISPAEQLARIATAQEEDFEESVLCFFHSTVLLLEIDSVYFTIGHLATDLPVGCMNWKSVDRWHAKIAFENYTYYVPQGRSLGVVLRTGPVWRPVQPMHLRITLVGK